MLAADFPQRNAILGKPDGMTDEQCYGLPVHRYTNDEGLECVVSRWRPTKEDMAEMNRTGDIWHHSLGPTVYPFCLLGENPFLPATARYWEPGVGCSFEQACEAAILLAAGEGIAVDFPFNGVMTRVYPDNRAPISAYVELYKAKTIVNHYTDLINAVNANTRPTV